MVLLGCYKDIDIRGWRVHLLSILGSAVGSRLGSGRGGHLADGEALRLSRGGGSQLGVPHGGAGLGGGEPLGLLRDKVGLADGEPLGLSLHPALHPAQQLVELHIDQICHSDDLDHFEV